MQKNRNAPWTERWANRMPVIGFFASILFSMALVALTLFRTPTPFETALLQFVILLTGLWGAYIMGKQSALSAARELIRPHARSAFRRVFSLYKRLYNLSVQIEEWQETEYNPRSDVIQAILYEQIVRGRDALEDWRDIIPEDVDEMLREDDRDDYSG